MSDWVISRRLGSRRAGSPSAGAADDPCRTGCSWGTAFPPPRSRTRTHHPMGDCRAPRRPNRYLGSGRISSPPPASGRSARACGSAVFATREELRELLLRHCAIGKGSEYVTSAAVRRECLWGWQFAFIGPPAAVLFHKLPCSPSRVTPILLRLPLHRWRFRVLHLERIGRAAGVVGRALALGHHVLFEAGSSRRTYFN